ncbi:hypothetical protein AHAS_Ahas17G0007200 [Arachis hypogaea]
MNLLMIVTHESQKCKAALMYSSFSLLSLCFEILLHSGFPTLEFLQSKTTGYVNYVVYLLLEDLSLINSRTKYN